MNFKKFGLGVFVLLTVFATTVAFTPSDLEEEKMIMFETDTYEEVHRVGDLLSADQMAEVEQLALAGFLKIRISVKNKNKGTDIVVEGGN